ncbi:hypothetical protein BGAL_0065g00260 [Botrytis galanthina]|uniref:Uncharacterized protein n=1 Tax=Botrytis galanthina TaxID=278940 RepID=A0A4S8R4N6_9HELO|nr:hypothetical protein BGAL_0065g00260 [Botrytis galanthina]
MFGVRWLSFTFEDFIYGQAELGLRFCIAHVAEPELKPRPAGEPWWKKLWPPSMLVDDVETVLRTYPPLLRRVRDFKLYIGFPSHNTEGSIDEQQRDNLGLLRR